MVNGEKTPIQIINTLGVKFTLSGDQKNTIDSLKQQKEQANENT